MMSAGPEATPPPFSWGNIGNPAYYAVWEGELRGVLYWDPAGVGELDGPGGEPVVTEPGWFLVPTNDPDHHVRVEAPDLEPGMSDHDLVAITERAFSTATQMLAERLGP